VKHRKSVSDWACFKISTLSGGLVWDYIFDLRVSERSRDGSDIAEQQRAERKFDVPPIAAKRLLHPMGCKFSISKNPPPFPGGGIYFEARHQKEITEMKVIECILLHISRSLYALRVSSVKSRHPKIVRWNSMNSHEPRVISFCHI